MFKKLLKKLNENQVRQDAEYDFDLSSNLQKNVQSINNIVGQSSDVQYREMIIGKSIPAAFFYIDGLCSIKNIEKEVVRPLMNISDEDMKTFPFDQIAEKLVKEHIEKSSTIYKTFDEAVHRFLAGDTLMVIDGIKKLIIIDSRDFEKRGIEEPQSEISIRGPRDGFNETLQTNISLIRRRTKDPNLIVQTGQLGRRSKSDFALLYMKGITNEDLIEEIRYRISCVDTDHVPETGTLEQLIEDNVLSPFPQFIHTERPDKTSAALLNGQVIILLSGTPFALMAPITFKQFFIATEDYYERWQIGTLIRMLRYLAGFMALFLPALYIAMVSYHHGMIPTSLALSIAGTREGVPFPAFIEALLMEITIEILREAGIRLPRPIGQTIGIVGGLVIGDAAVQAGIVSPFMVIVVGLTTIASFVMPSYSASITFRMLRFVLMLAAAILGLYGIIIIYILINIHLVGLRSFGSYYLSPFAPYHLFEWLDLVIRAPLTLLRSRTEEPHTLDKQKKKN